jgi:Cu(I)/Ag(I) efflux system membrane fusion protein
MNTKSKLIFVIIGLLLLGAGYILGSRHNHDLHATQSAATAEYTCPMHPFIVKDRPGACPICGMELVRKGAAVDATDLHLKEHVYLSPAQQVMANLDVVNVMYKPLFKVIDAGGVIAYDQSRQARVSAPVDGRIERLHAATVGMAVTKGNPAAELTSPELVGAEEAYLALYREAGERERSRLKQATGSPLYAAHLRLRELGFTEAEFRALEQSGSPDVLIPVYPALNGIVTSKEAQQGQFVWSGDPLVAIADLSQVWAELDVYEDEFPYLKTGQSVAVTTRAYPVREFTGIITFIYPFFDPTSRTVRVRVALQNRQLLLKPDMLVQARIRVPLNTDLAVPSEAVVVTGTRTLVWVQTKPGVFIPREVITGARYRNDIQILEGLKKDEVIAANGAYLIDSEAQLQTGERTSMTTAVPASPHGTMQPGMKTKDDMDMSDMHMNAQPGPEAEKQNKGHE